MADVRTIICASPQPQGKCHLLADRLATGLQRRFDRDGLRCFCLARDRIAPCTGCNSCAVSGACYRQDDMDRLWAALDESCWLAIVSPVYFAGPPAQLKAVFDRFQPRYFSRDAAAPKKPACLVAVGDGGDPHGFGPLEGIARSALATAGWDLVEVLPLIACSSDQATARLDAWLDGLGEGGRRARGGASAVGDGRI